MAYKIWVALSSKQFVDIYVCVPYYAVCFNNYNVTAKSYLTGTSTPVNVDEFVTVIAEWYGDLGGFMNAVITINPTTSCGADTMYSDLVSCGGEYYSYSGLTIYYPDPPESATQAYSLGPTVFGGCSC